MPTEIRVSMPTIFLLVNAALAGPCQANASRAVKPFAAGM